MKKKITLELTDKQFDALWEAANSHRMELVDSNRSTRALDNGLESLERAFWNKPKH